MSKFHTLTVQDVRRETPAAVSVAFTIPEELKKDYSFIAGQYVNIKYNHEGGELRRAYSISSAPNSDELRIVVKAVDKGVFSNYVNNHLKAGDVLEVGIPEGKFVYEAKDTDQGAYLGFAVGSGITPVISIAQSVLQSDEKNIFVLVYGNKSPEHTIYYDKIEALKTEYANRFFVYYTFTKADVPGSLFGRISRSTIQFVLKEQHNNIAFNAYYLCGPEDMIFKVKDILSENNISNDNIFFELFTPINDTAIEIKPGGQTQVKVLVDGFMSEYEMNKETDVLTAALKNGVDAPYSCQGGICSSCMCRVVEGEVVMKTNHILTEDEIEEGLILSCQSYPVSDVLVVDFDDV